MKQTEPAISMVKVFSMREIEMYAYKAELELRNIGTKSSPSWNRSGD